MEKEIRLTDQLMKGFLAMMLKDRGGSFTVLNTDPLLNMKDGEFKLTVLNGKSAKLMIIDEGASK